ncbi:MAG TPA: maltose alpha-D-glucosyltransferase [Longimicrobiaceae bacterium]|nr:maltose alpha-D-glucosyltransferase [Longimicrobiaceae bacterium]
MPTGDTLWYKDAVFYELHVKAFQDSNGDGMGDFRGATDRLDYLQSLGVDVVWLLPFSPSPLRDDGYDVADYLGVHPNYGTVEDFEIFLEEAHRRGLRVIADLVLNHTSDQHPWFQRARKAPKGSPERNFYVWSDTDDLYRDARIIFTDSEPSNWTWDPLAGQYYWHRFFYHQPDLNWDNPAVREAMFEVMEFWLDRGLDGFRCDAVPYLIEREGTNCENLPETHVILKELRARVDAKYPDRILLAEANQWPDDVRPYFGDGDEFHMAFHFPLMPRIFMAIRQGTRKPIVEIIQRTPQIPPDCHWCMFLRNHDELTLEMVTDEERDYMYKEYAADPRMRLNLGIRRRLAPLMENDRRKIELLNSVLLTMPGSPIIYYGDELGMGDNIYLGDRDGVRTPMQWSPDRNAGFSRAEAARLYLPVIVDSIYGFQGINVEAQERSPFSLLNWMKRLIHVRKQHRAFSRGEVEFLHPENSHVLAYLREYEGDTILMVQNLADSAQAVQLDLSRFAGMRPVELLGNTEFFPIEDGPYTLTLSPYGFFWFGLTGAPSGGTEAGAARRGAAGSIADASAGTLDLASLVREIPAEWLKKQRWFRGKARMVTGVELEDSAPLEEGGAGAPSLAIVRVSYAEGKPDLYLVPVRVWTGPGEPDGEVVASLPHNAGRIYLLNGIDEPEVGQRVLARVREGAEFKSSNGRFIAESTDSLKYIDTSGSTVRPLSAEQTNTNLAIGEHLILKMLRKLEPGTNPDLEVPQFLTLETDFTEIPELVGWVEYVGLEGFRGSAATLTRFVENDGDGWEITMAGLENFFAVAAGSDQNVDPAAGVRRLAGEYLGSVAELGRVTGRLHLALASARAANENFVAEPISEEDLAQWTELLQREASKVFDDVRLRLEAIPGAFREDDMAKVTRLVRNEAHFREQLDGLTGLDREGLLKIRHHGDYHLGQVLHTPSERSDREWVIMDFEGEPARPLDERRTKHIALRDVAGMLRSFNYAILVGLRDFGSPDLQGWADAWEAEVRSVFLDAYRETVKGAGIAPADDESFDRVVAAFEIEKAIYELRYEMNNRPDWIWIPLRRFQLPDSDEPLWQTHDG